MTVGSDVTVKNTNGRRPVVGTSTQSHKVGGWETAGAGGAIRVMGLSLFFSPLTEAVFTLTGLS